MTGPVKQIMLLLILNLILFVSNTSTNAHIHNHLNVSKIPRRHVLFRESIVRRNINYVYFYSLTSRMLLRICMAYTLYLLFLYSFSSLSLCMVRCLPFACCSDVNAKLVFFCCYYLLFFIVFSFTHIQIHINIHKYTHKHRKSLSLLGKNQFSPIIIFCTSSDFLCRRKFSLNFQFIV